MVLDLKLLRWLLLMPNQKRKGSSSYYGLRSLNIDDPVMNPPLTVRKVFKNLIFPLLGVNHVLVFLHC